jgi:hypothetical protein
MACVQCWTRRVTPPSCSDLHHSRPAATISPRVVSPQSLQAHAGAGFGPLGERLDDALRAAVYERLQVRVLAPRESVPERGKPLEGLFVVVVGALRVGGTGTEHPPLLEILAS